MVKVDDATYIAMRDNLYKWDSAAASKAKAQIESSYTDEQYNKFVSQLWGVKQQPTAPSNTPASTPANTQTTTPQQTTPEMKQETEIKQQETVGSTVPEIKQEWALKPLSQDYYNQTSDDAQSKIISNLNNYRQTNPEYFRDYESFKKNFSYDARNDEQKQTLDSWYWGYQKWMELAWIPVTDLYTQYKDGQVSMNELENLRIYDPTKYAELQNQINKWNIIAAYDDDKWVDTTWMSIQDMAYNMAAQTFTKLMSGEWASEASQFFRDYEAKMDSPEMLALSDQCTEVQEQMENIQSDLDSIKKQVEAEYEWTWATRSKINAIIADRSYDLQLQLRTLNSEYNKYATQYNNRMQQYQNEFSMQLQEYQLNQQARNQQMQELWFAMDLMNFETNEQKAQREWDYWVKQQEYTNWNINSSDYQTRYKAALKSVQNLLAQYEWIPMQRSAEQMAQDILTAIDQGSDLGTELTKINKQIQSKPEYKYLYNNTFWNKSTGTDLQTYKIWDTDYVMYNGQLIPATEFNRMYGWSTWWNPKPYDVVSEEMFSIDPSKWGLWAFLMDSKNANGKYWWQCAKFVNNYLEKIWVGRYFWEEDIKTREQRANSDTPKVWTIAIFDYWVISKKTGKNHGHVAIVTQVNSDWSFVVKESNYPSWETIWTRTVNPNSTSLKWFFDPSKWASNVGESVSETSTWDNGIKRDYVETRVWLYDKYLNEWTAPTDAKLKAIWGGDIDKWWQIFDAEVADYMEKTWAWSLDKKKNDEINKLRAEMHQQDAYKDYTSMQTYYEKIKNASNNETATAASDVSLLFAYMKMLDPKSIVRESEFATAQNMWSLPTKWHAQLKSAVNGKKLTDAQRTQILNETKTLMDSATYLYNNLLDDYTAMINYGWNANNLGKKWEYITDEYKAQYWTSNWSTSSSNKTNSVSGLNLLKNSLNNLSSNIKLSSNTKTTLQSKYWINN